MKSSFTKKNLKNGVLCYAVLTPYKGKGAPKVILHAVDLEETGTFSYGHKDHIVLNPPNKRK